MSKASNMQPTDENWFAFIGSRVYSYMNYMLKEKFGKRFPKMDYSYGTPQSYGATLPAWHMEELEQVERGQDLTNTTVNAVYETIEVRIATNDDFDLCHEIATETTLLFKELHFNIAMSPTFTRTETKKVNAIARYSRVVGKGEI